MILNWGAVLLSVIAALLVILAVTKAMQGLRWLAAYKPTAFVFLFALLVAIGVWLIWGAL